MKTKLFSIIFSLTLLSTNLMARENFITDYFSCMNSGSWGLGEVAYTYFVKNDDGQWLGIIETSGLFTNRWTKIEVLESEIGSNEYDLEKVQFSSSKFELRAERQYDWSWDAPAGSIGGSITVKSKTTSLSCSFDTDFSYTIKHDEKKTRQKVSELVEAANR